MILQRGFNCFFNWNDCQGLLLRYHKRGCRRWPRDEYTIFWGYIWILFLVIPLNILVLRRIFLDFYLIGYLRKLEYFFYRLYLNEELFIIYVNLIIWNNLKCIYTLWFKEVFLTVLFFFFLMINLIVYMMLFRLARLFISFFTNFHH